MKQQLNSERVKPLTTLSHGTSKGPKSEKVLLPHFHLPSWNSAAVESWWLSAGGVASYHGGSLPPNIVDPEAVWRGGRTRSGEVLGTESE